MRKSRKFLINAHHITVRLKTISNARVQISKLSEHKTEIIIDPDKDRLCT